MLYKSVIGLDSYSNHLAGKTAYVFIYYSFFLDEENSLHVVVNCGEALLKNNTYWPLVSDFINILSHQSVAKKFLEDHGLLVTWMNFVSFFQGRHYHFLNYAVVYNFVFICYCLCTIVLFVHVHLFF